VGAVGTETCGGRSVLIGATYLASLARAAHSHDVISLARRTDGRQTVSMQQSSPALCTLSVEGNQARGIAVSSL